ALRRQRSRYADFPASCSRAFSIFCGQRHADAKPVFAGLDAQRCGLAVACLQPAADIFESDAALATRRRFVVTIIFDDDAESSVLDLRLQPDPTAVGHGRDSVADGIF